MRKNWMVALGALCVSMLAAAQLGACRGRNDQSRLGREGDPGFVEQKTLGSSSAHAGPIEGEFAGAVFHVAYYQQPDAQPPVLGLEYGAFDANHGGYWLHVALWGQAQLPEDIDLATYRAKSPYGELERVQVEFARPLDDDEDHQDLRHAIAGRLRFHVIDGRAQLELIDLVFDDPQALGEPALVGGTAQGDVVYQCYLYDVPPASAEPPVSGNGVMPLPNPDLLAALYTEDLDLSSAFCASMPR